MSSAEEQMDIPNFFVITNQEKLHRVVIKNGSCLHISFNITHSLTPQEVPGPGPGGLKRPWDLQGMDKWQVSGAE